VVGGTAEGTLHLWDLRESNSLHATRCYFVLHCTHPLSSLYPSHSYPLLHYNTIPHNTTQHNTTLYLTILRPVTSRSTPLLCSVLLFSALLRDTIDLRIAKGLRKPCYSTHSTLSSSADSHAAAITQVSLVWRSSFVVLLCVLCVLCCVVLYCVVLYCVVLCWLCCVLRCCVVLCRGET
jgi:hypothetical protein